jgi:hypothetical protein
MFLLQVDVCTLTLYWDEYGSYTDTSNKETQKFEAQVSLTSILLEIVL